MMCTKYVFEHRSHPLRHRFVSMDGLSSEFRKRHHRRRFASVKGIFSKFRIPHHRAISSLILNWIIAFCLVRAENRKKGKKVARYEALELPAGDMPVELKEDGLHELDIALPELNEDTFHEMFVSPVELSGDMWPELHGRPSSVSCCDPSVN